MIVKVPLNICAPENPFQSHLSQVHSHRNSHKYIIKILLSILSSNVLWRVIEDYEHSSHVYNLSGINNDDMLLKCSKTTSQS
jgi:hypothetical protein